MLECHSKWLNHAWKAIQLCDDRMWALPAHATICGENQRRKWCKLHFRNAVSILILLLKLMVSVDWRDGAFRTSSRNNAFTNYQQGSLYHNPVMYITNTDWMHTRVFIQRDQPTSYKTAGSYSWVVQRCQATAASALPKPIKTSRYTYVSSSKHQH